MSKRGTKGNRRAQQRRAKARKKLERHYAEHDNDVTLCGKLVTTNNGALLVVRDRDQAALTVTCDLCREKLLPLKSEKLPEPKPGETGSCALCNQAGLGEGQYCFGCRRYICEPCSTNPDMPWGSHLPSAHREDEP